MASYAISIFKSYIFKEGLHSFCVCDTVRANIHTTATLPQPPGSTLPLTLLSGKGTLHQIFLTAVLSIFDSTDTDYPNVIREI